MAPETPTSRPPAEFAFRIGGRSRRLLRLIFGVRPERDRVRVDDEAIDVQFGRARLHVPLANVATWRIEGPWRWITAIGIRRSIRHGDMSFAGSPRGGVRVDLRERMRWGRLRVPAFYVGVEDLEGFARELEARGVPGTDVRTAR